MASFYIEMQNEAYHHVNFVLEKAVLTHPVVAYTYICINAALGKFFRWISRRTPQICTLYNVHILGLYVRTYISNEYTICSTFLAICTIQVR